MSCRKLLNLLKKILAASISLFTHLPMDRRYSFSLSYLFVDHHLYDKSEVSKCIMQVSKPLLETSRNGYLAAISASSYSFVSLLKHFVPIMNPGTFLFRICLSFLAFIFSVRVLLVQGEIIFTWVQNKAVGIIFIYLALNFVRFFFFFWEKKKLHVIMCPFIHNLIWSNYLPTTTDILFRHFIILTSWKYWAFLTLLPVHNVN